MRLAVGPVSPWGGSIDRPFCVFNEIIDGEGGGFGNRRQIAFQLSRTLIKPGLDSVSVKPDEVINPNTRNLAFRGPEIQSRTLDIEPP
jgi:hypothetical protein